MIPIGNIGIGSVKSLQKKRIVVYPVIMLIEWIGYTKKRKMKASEYILKIEYGI